MREIFSSVIRKKVTVLIKTLGIDVDEVVMKISLEVAEFDSIEWNEDSQRIYLNIFDDNLEYSMNFDDLTEFDKLEVYYILYEHL